ncbi:MAG TPA: DUF790 family protein [Phycisphaerae bacterium]|jgi:predicted nuclease of restriction endonuclease-like RecB superfamily|nr:DUF790 family protein [Phycisphaerae bacterium]HOB75635.1 DUF790 family protein [Phycisphaerae bacterium]HOJ56308.1 DUF790 family protein [Phycisphaerae bacterium]HOL28191.1 DUF790 family protein [Phycisphaerae bacterium]HPP22455.1 DUF790 family protein [Phycisphaerae bacterium]
MLPKELALYTCIRGRAHPDRLTRRTHAHYVPLAARLLDLYRQGAGRTREELHRAGQALFADDPDCPPQRVQALLQLLDQASEYQTDIDGRACRLRLKVFELAAARHPLVTEPNALFQSRESEVKEAIAGEVGMLWPRVEAAMYADLPAFHRLIRLNGYDTPEALLRRYNVAQAQTLLFWAEEMVVTAREDYERIFRHAKRNGLLHEIEAVSEEEFRIRFTGPVAVLHQTRRYGVNMAAFLPVLLTCKRWELSARLRLPQGLARFDLSPRDRLQSHLSAPDEYDSELERCFVEKFGLERDGWTCRREGGFLVQGRHVFVPDFSFHHTDGTCVYLEIVRFWTPQYLEARRETLIMFADVPILVAVAADHAAKVPELAREMLRFRARLKVKPVLERLNAMRAGRR